MFGNRTENDGIIYIDDSSDSECNARFGIESSNNLCDESNKGVKITSPDDVICIDDDDDSISNQGISSPTTRPLLNQDDAFHLHCAYVQNLAEISYTILHDTRWTTNHDTLANNTTDVNNNDTNISSFFSSLFLPPSLSKQNDNYNEVISENNSILNEKNQCSTSLTKNENNLIALMKFATLYIPGPKRKGSLNVNKEMMHDIEHHETKILNLARCMRLYARLFHRKGPWFQITDLFMRYYYKNYNNAHNHIDRDNDNSNDSNNVNDENSSSKQQQKQHQGEKSLKWTSIQTLIQAFFQDLYSLYTMGLIRTYHNEVECASVVGDPHQSNMFITQKDRLEILHRLGGGGYANKKNHLPNKQHRNTVKSSQNLILEQIRSQKQLMFAPIVKTQAHASEPSSSLIENPERRNNDPTLLPVRTHVDHLLLHNFVQAISSLVIKNVKDDNDIKSQDGVNRTDPDSLIIYFTKLWEQTICKSAYSETSSKSSIPFFTCLRLQESPLYTLRRASRLYLCASNGSSRMRNGDVHGWISVTDESILLNAKTSTFLRKQGPDLTCDEVSIFNSDDADIKSRKKQKCQDNTHSFSYPTKEIISNLPSKSQWNQVIFPGLQYRLGLIDFSYTKNYIPLPHNESAKFTSHQDINKTQDFQLEMIRVFNHISNFHMWEMTVELRYLVDCLQNYNETILLKNRMQRNRNDHESIKELHSIALNSNFSTKNYRKKILSELLIFQPSQEGRNKAIETLHHSIEKTIDSLNIFSTDSNNKCKEGGNDTHFTDGGRLLCVIAIIGYKVLLYRIETIMDSDMHLLRKRPWLRHLTWECVLAYLLWDCVSILEKRGFHLLAINILGTIVLGTDCVDDFDHIPDNTKEIFVSYLLPRRCRGKVFERLIIDYTHVLRHDMKSSKSVQYKVNKLCSYIAKKVGPNGSVPFNFVRKYAHRLKRPLGAILEDEWNPEMLELGIRLGTDSGNSMWHPVTDQSIATALQIENSNRGQRCRFMGVDEATRSLNVEELAIEEYASGRLPLNSDELSGGGWRGWHAEGRHIRSLFHILCSEPLLGYETFDIEEYTIFLTPYQHSPGDLYVGHHFIHTSESDERIAGRSFYERRREFIDNFFVHLTSISAQNISDLVYDSIMRRYNNITNSHGRHIEVGRDNALIGNMSEIRTLSMLAAGLGGEQLVTLFRCLCYDYRHYMAGLPDLLLVRAKVDQYANTDPSCNFMKMDEWIGEGFRHQAGYILTSSIFVDFYRDFLDDKPNGNQTHSSSRNTKALHDKLDDIFKMGLPKRLSLTQGENEVKVQCLFVEVKSSNDSLDERQIDWLNIIDRVGFARVCKFVSSLNRK